MKNIFGKYAFLILFLCILPITAACLCFGSVFINIFSANYSETQTILILKLRALRLLTCFTVGGSLAVSGAAYQAVLRNPLAEPFILGISGGASLGAALAIISGLTFMSWLSLPIFSFAGALTVLTLVLFMARGAGVEYTNNIMLSGVIAASVCSSILMFIISIAGSHELNGITWWLLGNLQPQEPALLASVIVILLAGSITLFLFGRDINLISMGEENAYSSGVSPVFIILLTLGIASLMTASAVALSGIIGFVGLVVPHVLRKFIGADQRKLFPAAIIAGGIFVMLCDTVGRTLISPQEIPVGVISSLIGGPFFLYILNRRKRSSNE